MHGQQNVKIKRDVSEMLRSFHKAFSAATFVFTSDFCFDYHNPAFSHEQKTPFLEITM